MFLLLASSCSSSQSELSEDSESSGEEICLPSELSEKNSCELSNFHENEEFVVEEPTHSLDVSFEEDASCTSESIVEPSDASFCESELSVLSATFEEVIEEINLSENEHERSGSIACSDESLDCEQYEHHVDVVLPIDNPVVVKRRHKRREVINKALEEIDRDMPDIEDLVCDTDESSEEPDDDETCSVYSEDSVGNAVIEEGECNTQEDGYQDIIAFPSMLSLYNGSDLTAEEAIVTMLKLHFANSGKKSDFQRTLSTVHMFLPKDNTLPKSVHLLFKCALDVTPVNIPLKQFYCTTCVVSKGTTNRPCENIQCNDTNSSFFFNLDLEAIVKYWFESLNLADLMDNFFMNVSDAENVIRDIIDGSQYKALNVNRKRYDITLVTSTDGVHLRCSSVDELWTLLCMPVEVPCYLRSSLITVLAIWCDRPKPNMNIFVRPFAKQLKSIQDKGGVSWKHPKTGQLHVSNVIAPVFVADAPARAKLMNSLNHNGTWGCNLCEIKTVRTRPVQGLKSKRVYPYRDILTLRDHNRTVTLGLLVAQSGIPNFNLMGIKGPCILTMLLYIHLGKFLYPEFMHSVCLGVVKQVMLYWFDAPGLCSEHILDINSLLRDIKVPDFIHRLPRVITDLKYFKAAEFLFFLLYYSLPVMKGFLPDAHWQHHILLVNAIYALCQSEITFEEIDEAEVALKQYVAEFEGLYGDRQLTYNVHLLLHLSESVRLWGPLTEVSAFPFEGFNAVISNSTHGSKNLPQEIVNKIRLVQGYHVLNSKVEFNRANKTKEDCGLGKKIRVVLNQRDREILALAGCPTNTEVFSRAQVKSEVYTSSSYKELKTASYYICWKEAESLKVGSIRFFSEWNDGLFLFVDAFLSILFQSMKVTSQ